MLTEDGPWRRARPAPLWPAFWTIANTLRTASAPAPIQLAIRLDIALSAPLFGIPDENPETSVQPRAPRDSSFDCLKLIGHADQKKTIGSYQLSVVSFG